MVVQRALPTQHGVQVKQRHVRQRCARTRAFLRVPRPGPRPLCANSRGAVCLGAKKRKKLVVARKSASSSIRGFFCGAPAPALAMRVSSGLLAAAVLVPGVAGQGYYASNWGYAAYAYGDWGTIGGGSYHLNEAPFATVGGGHANYAYSCE